MTATIQVIEGFGTQDFLSDLPRPTDGKLIVDFDNSAIHGVALIGPESRNDGAIFSREVHEDFARLINESGNPVVVQMGHFEKTTEENGVIVNAYVDGRVLRGSHYLNPHYEGTPGILWNAHHAQSNRCYSVESFERDLVYERVKGRKTIVKATGIKWFSMDRHCGTTKGMNGAHSARLESKMTDTKKRIRIKTTEHLKLRYPELMTEFEDAVRAECACEAKDRAESAAALAEVEEKMGTLTKERDELKERLERIESEEQARVRIDEIKEQWKSLIEGVDISLLPDTEDGKKIAALAELSEDDLKTLAALKPEEATNNLELRVSTIRNNLTIAESFKGKSKDDSFIDIKPADDKKQDRRSGKKLDLGGGRTIQV